MNNVPGLVSRKIVDSDEETVTYEEIWDLTVPRCPMIAINRIDFTISTGVKSLIRKVTYPHYGDHPEEVK
jgi:hypothetical protein